MSSEDEFKEGVTVEELKRAVISYKKLSRSLSSTLDVMLHVALDDNGIIWDHMRTMAFMSIISNVYNAKLVEAEEDGMVISVSSEQDKKNKKIIAELSSKLLRNFKENKHITKLT